jgi:PleD family two-component response regulator
VSEPVDLSSLIVVMMELFNVVAGRGTTIVLVVEDEAPRRLAVTKILHKRGFDVLEAADGNAALSRRTQPRGAG